MGIEPTDRMISIRPDGFEDRGRHQPCKHFRLCSIIRQRYAELIVAAFYIAD